MSSLAERGAPATGSPAKRKKYGKPTFKSPTLAGKGGPICAAFDVMPHVDKFIQSGNREMGEDSEDRGGIQILAERAAQINCHTASRYLRRIFDLRRGWSRSMDHGIADVLFLAGGDNISESDVACLPPSITVAREMVDVWCEEMTRLERRNLAVKLLHFAQGYVHEWNVLEMPDVPARR